MLVAILSNLIYSHMKKYSMLAGALSIIAVNLYGIIISTVISPITPAMLTTSILVILIVGYIELNKRRVLINNCTKQSFILFAIVMFCQAYYTIMPLTLLIYFSSIDNKKQSTVNFTGLAVGLNTLPQQQVEGLNLSYYFANFFLFIYYLRCYFVMFWKENIVFIFRYLKKHVNYLNQSLLSHLPKVSCSQQLSETICSLCLQNFSEHQDITKLSCQHPFHLDCIKVWVMRSNCCPLCRKKVLSN